MSREITPEMKYTPGGDPELVFNPPLAICELGFAIPSADEKLDVSDDAARECATYLLGRLVEIRSDLPPNARLQSETRIVPLDLLSGETQTAVAVHSSASLRYGDKSSVMIYARELSDVHPEIQLDGFDETLRLTLTAQSRQQTDAVYVEYTIKSGDKRLRCMTDRSLGERIQALKSAVSLDAEVVQNLGWYLAFEYELLRAGIDPDSETAITELRSSSKEFATLSDTNRRDFERQQLEQIVDPGLMPRNVDHEETLALLSLVGRLRYPSDY